MPDTRWANGGGFPWRVLDAPHDQMLSQYFDRQALGAIDRHWRPPLPAPPGEVAAWQARLRAQLRHDLGVEGLPRADLRARTVRRTDMNGYALEQVTFESQPGLLMAASVYLPLGVGRGAPVPAVLCPHGHTGPLGRLATKEQARGIGLARRGYVAMSLDMIGHGEITFMGHNDAMHLPATGLSLAGLQAWDNIRALDYLSARPEVDAARLGCTGSSGGGNQTLYLAALDERVQVAAPVCSVETFRDYMQRWRCTCETAPNVLRYAEMSDVLAAAAPRALLIISGITDRGFSIASARETFLRLRAVYDALNAPERVGMAECYSGHDYNRAMRAAMYSWFDRWLRPAGPSGAERRTAPATTGGETGAQLVLEMHSNERPTAPATAGGEGVENEADPALRALPPGGAPPVGVLTVPELYAQHSAARLAAAIQRWRDVPASARRAALIEGVLGGVPERTPLSAERTVLPPPGAEAVTFFSEPEIVVPGILLHALDALPGAAPGEVPGGQPGAPPGGARAASSSKPPGERPGAARGLVIGVHGNGKQALIDRQDVSDMRRAGLAVLLLDYRGTGETRPADAWNPRRSLMLGRHLLGLQAWDVRRAVDWAAAQPDLDGPIFLWGEGPAAVVAILTAACDTRIAATAVTGLIAAFAADVDARLAQDQCPWRLFDWGDIPDIAGLIAPRALLAVNPADGHGRLLAADVAPACFQRTTDAYARDASWRAGQTPGVAPAHLDNPFTVLTDPEEPARRHVVPWLRHWAPHTPPGALGT